MTDQVILKLYEEYGHNKSALADALGVSRVTVWNRLSKLLGETDPEKT